MHQVEHPAVVKSAYVKGMWVHAAGKLKRKLLGFRKNYVAPLDLSRVGYDFNVVDAWLNNYGAFTGESITGKTVLELGPGSNLGTGLILLSRGAKKYLAIDVFDSVQYTQEVFYDHLFERLGCDALRAELAHQYEPDGRIHYMVDPQFRIERIDEPVDVIFSHSAFEHFDDVAEVIRQITAISAPGTTIISRVDLQTHELGVRDCDPLNIYRYSDTLWRWLGDKGAPNRTRTPEYQRILEDHGWEAEIEPVRTLTREYVDKMLPGLIRRYQNFGTEEMGILGFFMRATKK